MNQEQATTGGFPVSKSALIARINRRLRYNDQRLRVARGFWTQWDLGHYWVQDVRRNLVLRKFVDLEQLGRELGALAESEDLATGEKIRWRPPLVPGAPQPRLGKIRFKRIFSLCKEFERLNGRRPSHMTFIHNGKRLVRNGVRVTAVALEGGGIYSIEKKSRQVRRLSSEVTNMNTMQSLHAERSRLKQGGA